jgi:hypothetical protein
MSTAETEPAGIDPQVLADLNAVMKRMIDGTPVDLETSRRIEKRADGITEELQRTRGAMDDDRFQGLLHDDDDGKVGVRRESRGKKML